MVARIRGIVFNKRIFEEKKIIGSGSTSLSVHTQAISAYLKASNWPQCHLLVGSALVLPEYLVVSGFKKITSGCTRLFLELKT